MLLDDGEQTIWCRSSVSSANGSTHWMPLPDPPPRERSEVPADTDTSEPETASERRSGGFTGKDTGSTSSIDVTSDRFIVVRFNGQQLGPINGDAVRRLDDLCHWLTSYVEECRESRDAAADDGDYESALRHRTRVEVLEEVVLKIEEMT